MANYRNASVKRRASRNFDRQTPPKGASDGKEATPSKPKKPWSPMNYLLWLQGRREHSRTELHQKLMQKLREKDLIEVHDPEALLDRLAELGLQSDQRFIEGQVRQATSSGRGRGWVKQRLYRHKLSSDAVEEALSGVEDEEWEREAYALARRRYGEGPYPYDRRAKIGNFLIRRGYGLDLVRKITGQNWPDTEIDD